MSDDFGTVSAKQGERAKEIEMLRQRYRHHRDALQRMIPDAPTEHLADAYVQVTAEIDDALRKLDEMEGRAPAAAESAAASAPRARTAAGDRPLERHTFDDAPPSAGGNAMPRVILIIAAGLLVVAVIAYLMWHGSAKPGKVITETTAPADTAAPSTVTPVAPATETTTPIAASASIKITPALSDFGVIRKGTRAVRPFDVMNTGSDPITIEVSRSACHCLFYEFRNKIAPKKRETITVAVDGARAKAGPLHETVTVTTKEDPSVTAQFVVQATIK
jgi:hypothetical protein